MDYKLNLRTIPPHEKEKKFFETFSGLEPGGSFIITDSLEPGWLLEMLQEDLPGEFDWWPLQQGPRTWRVIVARRMVQNPDRTITEYFQSDHRRLETIYKKFGDAVHEERWDDARSAFVEFSLGLRRHIKAEEEILFPAFEEKTGMSDAGPTFVMRMEHKDIFELFDQITGSAEKDDGPETTRLASALTNLLADHNMKEEQILYPESDALLSETERPEVVSKAQSF